jgi:hypothetical protein
MTLLEGAANTCVGVNMTNETTKALLMIFLFGGLEAAIHASNTWKSRRWTFLDHLTKAWISPR